MKFQENSYDSLSKSTPESYDIVVYGGSSAGIASAIQASKMGKKVIIIEQTQRIGGLTTNGLGQTDIGAKSAIGGIARDFYREVRLHYSKNESWTCQKNYSYKSEGQSMTAQSEDAMWTFEPSVALRIYDQWIDGQKIPVVYHERLNRSAGVRFEENSKRISSITMESGRTFYGRMFIDATYEGDLMASAGVSYAWGRESNNQYGETLNGIQYLGAVNHQMRPHVDPYIKKGDPTSNLLPFIEPSRAGSEGDGDRRMQAYCFRMCLTNCPENRIPFEKPDGYHELWHELLLRNFEAGQATVPWINASMPNMKTDTNNCNGVSTDFIGQNYDYPEGSYEEREKIVQKHLLYQKGLMWTMANHPRVPQAIREIVSQYGVCKDEFTENGGWPVLLYIREARRMIGDYVMTQSDCQGKRVAEDSIGLAAYTMDSHNAQRYIDQHGHVQNEGNIEIGGFPPYPISYRAIVPKNGECENLLVPVCLSASHIAYGSIRMEPVFMVLGQSAAIAAALAIESNIPVQRVDYSKLKPALLADKQILSHPSSK